MAQGRPTALQSKQRTGRFLILVAEGRDIVEARKEAGIDADRALRIVGESDFREIVDAIRERFAEIAA